MSPCTWEDEPTTTTTESTTATTTTTTTALSGDVVFTLETACAYETVEAGDTIELDVSISEAVGLNSLQLCFDYDETQLAFVSVQLQEVLNAFDLREIVTAPQESLADGGELWVTAASSGSSCDVTQDDVILTLTFEALCDIEDFAEITIRQCDATTVTSVMEDRVLTCVGVGGGITIEDALIGDVNNDTVVDLDDAVRLFYYVNDLVELTDEERKRADVAKPTDNVVVDLDDAVRLFYSVNGLIDLSA